ncbi:hypothetical protein AB1Y20_001307 [Prymnesium parvum]|uniref:GmrSD restriction endonucleases N-terminal domain-containing protein n=1 Tax=Prymnesium parvum TaxID=97485 RepID=A0AB34KB18_PRYPA
MLVLAAPLSSGLPNGATAIVRSSRFDSTLGCWLYDVTLTGGGKHGSDVRCVPAVREGWLRTEGRIATAKNCAPMSFRKLMLSAPRLLVPLFQRRYCWSRKEWERLWKDVWLPSGIGPHFIGRVVVCRDREALVVVDGQQRCTTMLLLLAAVRDAASKLSAAAESPGVTARAARLRKKLEAVLRTRTRLTPREATPRHSESAAEHSGLEGLSEAWSVRFVPSRDDRLPFCSLVLGEPFEAQLTAGSRKMLECYNTFKEKVNGLLDDGEGLQLDAPLPSERQDEKRCQAHSMEVLERHLERLEQVATNALDQVNVVYFELQDDVAVQNMYDMLAQREKKLNAFFSNVGGKLMSEADLVRNLLLNHIADEDTRYEAYNTYWRVIEREHGDGDVAHLERFLFAYLAEQRTSVQVTDSLTATPGKLSATDETLVVEDGAAPSREHSLPLPDGELLQGFALLLKSRGGSCGAASLYAAGTEAAGIEVVDEKATTNAAMAVFKELVSFTTLL